MTLLIAATAAIFFAFYFDVLESERIAGKFAGSGDVDQIATGIRSAVGAVMFAGFYLFFRIVRSVHRRNADAYRTPVRRSHDVPGDVLARAR